MKNLRILFISVTLCTCLFSSCKKDDEEVSPGYFIIDGVQYNLGKAYFEYYNIMTHHANNMEYMEHTVTFLSDGFVWKNGEVISGKGDVAIIQFMDPLKVQIPEAGNYTFQFDNDPVKSYTYFDFSLITNVDPATVNTDTNEAKYYEIRELVKITKKDDNLEFSSKGTTRDGKTFEFYYQGTILPIPAN